MLFRTKYSEPQKISSESGSRFAPVYSLVSKEAGCIELEISGEKDIYQEIQSHADSVDIKTIIQRYQMGDSAALNQRIGQYVDITDMPTNFADIMKTVITAENQFNELPIEIRKEYEFSVSKYIADIGSDHWKNLFAKEEVQTIIEPVKEMTVNE